MILGVAAASLNSCGNHDWLGQNVVMRTATAWSLTIFNRQSGISLKGGNAYASRSFQLRVNASVLHDWGCVNQLTNTGN